MADEETELSARFAGGGGGGGGGKLEADVISELRSVMQLYRLSVQDTLFKWESFCLRRGLDANDVSLEAVRDLKGSIHDELERERNKSLAKSNKKMAVAPKNTRAGAAATASVMGMLDSILPPLTATPGKGSKRKLDSSPLVTGEHGTSSSFNDRVKSGEVIEVLNGHLLSTATEPTKTYPESRIKLTAASDQKKMGYKPLAMKLSETSEILDDRIDDWAELIRDHHKLDESVFGNAAAQGTTEIVAVGRIASDATTDEGGGGGGRLNAASLVLETSRRTGMGFRVPLNLDSVARWSFFPGQVVALRGSNASGSYFVVKELLEAPLLPGAASAAAALDASRERLRGGRRRDEEEEDKEEPAPLNVIFASGPYTADDNLDFEPLHALCDRAADGVVDVIVLAGPFIDIDHPLIASGDFDLPEDVDIDPDTATMTTVFRYLFAPALNRLASSRPQLTMMLVPSVRDVLAKHVSWPQDAFPRKDLGLPRTARILSNPMTLSINEMLLAVSTQDILYQLRGQEVVAKGAAAAQGDLMARLCRYLIEQRHYFPLFPPTDRSKLPRAGTEDGIATGSVLDLGYIKLGEMVNVRPDVMLIPSALPPFVKVVESVVAINPGYLSKRKGAGTYAHMTLHCPEATSGVEAETIVSHRIFDRARVEIIRI